MPLYREFARLDEFSRMPDESTILWFRHRLEKYKLANAMLAFVNDLLREQGLLLKEGSAVDATHCRAQFHQEQIGKRDPEMHSSKKGNQWHLGMKAHIGVDADSGQVHTVHGTARLTIWPMSLKAMACCMTRKPSSLPTQVIKALPSGPTLSRTRKDTWQ